MREHISNFPYPKRAIKVWSCGLSASLYTVGQLKETQEYSEDDGSLYKWQVGLLHAAGDLVENLHIYELTHIRKIKLEKLGKTILFLKKEQLCQQFFALNKGTFKNTKRRTVQKYQQSVPVPIVSTIIDSLWLNTIRTLITTNFHRFVICPQIGSCLW